MAAGQSKRARDPERTRRALLEAAERLFAERGLDGTRTDDIALDSGVNKAMISYHFGGKHGLYSAVLGGNMEPALERLATLMESPAPAPERLAEFIRIFGDLHIQKPRLSEMILREILAGGRNLDEEALPRFLRVFSVLSGILEQGRADRTLRDVPVIHAHLSIVGGLTFFFSTQKFRHRIVTQNKVPVDDPSAAEFVEFFQELISRALSPNTEPAPSSAPPKDPSRRKAR